MKIRKSCTHAVVVDILIYINNHKDQCFSKWKCYQKAEQCYRKTEQLVDNLAKIRSEKSEELEKAGCQKIEESKDWINIGKLDENEGHEGIYWLDANLDSKDCEIPKHVFERPIHGRTEFLNESTSTK